MLDARPDRVEALLAAVRGGKIHGVSAFIGPTPGEYGCVVATLWDITVGSDQRVSQIIKGLFKVRKGLFKVRWSEIESTVEEVRPGQTPATSPALALVEQWVVAWQDQRSAS